MEDEIKDSPSFVLVHGGWGGGWQWREIAEQLIRNGFSAFAPTLTGLGERSHLASPEIGLSTYIQDIENVIHYEQLERVIPVGFSYSGLVVTGVAERIPEKITHIIYVDAFVPRDGESLQNIAGEKISNTIRTFANLYGNGWKIDSFINDDPRSTPQPIKTSEEPVAVKNPAARGIPRTYIRCTGKRKDWVFTPVLDRCADYARSSGWDIREIESDHFPMKTAPKVLLELLLEIGRQSAR